MANITVHYEGQLRSNCIHLQSGNTLITDAPTDNNGKGEAFSPTDLLATSLASCMITVMGINAEQNDIEFQGVEAEVEKIMGADPRRVQGVNIKISMDAKLTEKERTILERTAVTCPVALSLGKELNQRVEFNYV